MSMALNLQTAVFLQAENISRVFPASRGFWQKKTPEKNALRDVFLFLRERETVGLIGASGSGKSTLLKILLGMESADSGTVRCQGQLIKPGSVNSLKGYRRQVQYIPQDPASSLAPHQSVAALIREPVQRLRAETLSDKQLKGWMDRVGLREEVLSKKAGALSGGQAQRVVIARALALHPAFLFADEPVSGLDLPLREQIKQLLNDLTDELGMGLLLVTHDFSLLPGLCDRTLVMHQGEIVEDGATRNLMNFPRHAYTRQLIQAIPRLDSVRRRCAD